MAHRERAAILTGIDSRYLTAGQTSLTLAVGVAVTLTCRTGPAIAAIIQVTHRKRAPHPLIGTHIHTSVPIPVAIDFPLVIVNIDNQISSSRVAAGVYAGRSCPQVQVVWTHQQWVDIDVTRPGMAALNIAIGDNQGRIQIIDLRCSGCGVVPQNGIVHYYLRSVRIMHGAADAIGIIFVKGAIGQGRATVISVMNRSPAFVTVVIKKITIGDQIIGIVIYHCPPIAQVGKITLKVAVGNPAQNQMDVTCAAIPDSTAMLGLVCRKGAPGHFFFFGMRR
jgi:hypothetical protein